MRMQSSFQGLSKHSKPCFGSFLTQVYWQKILILSSLYWKIFLITLYSNLYNINTNAIIGKEEYTDIVCEEGSDSSCNRTLNRPHLLGVGSPLGETLKHVNYTGNSLSQEQSLSHNVGIYVWGAYQVKQHLTLFSMYTLI